MYANDPQTSVHLAIVRAAQMTPADSAFYMAIAVAVSNVALAILTAIYVVFTREMVRHMREAREPSVFVDFEFLERQTRLVIGNSSDSPAINIHFFVSGTIPWQHETDGIRNIGAVRDGLPFLAPRRMLKFYAGYVDWERLENGNGLASISIVYEDEAKHEFKREYILDIRKFDQVAGDSFQEPSVAVAKAIRDAENSRSHERFMQQFGKGLFRSRPKTKTCSYCGKSIPQAAKKCPECHEFLIPDESSDSVDQISLD